jgi:hypothetical protein
VYLVTATGMGLLASALTRSQIAAMFAALLGTLVPATQFAGMTTPVSSLEGLGRLVGDIHPATHMSRSAEVCQGAGTSRRDSSLACCWRRCPSLWGWRWSCCASRSTEMPSGMTNLWQLTLKEWWSLWRDRVMLCLIVLSFTEWSTAPPQLFQTH